MNILVEYKSNKVKLDISQIKDLNSLIQKIKTIFNIDKDKEIELYNQPKKAFLMETNFEEEFLKVKNDIKGIFVEDVIDLAEKIKNIGVPINKIDEFDEDEESNNKTLSIVLNKHQNFKDKCSLCKGSFDNGKYGCLLCYNYFLCNKCEEHHYHPMIKYKTDCLSDAVKKILDIRVSQYYKEDAFYKNLINGYKLKNLYKLGLRTNIASNSFIMGNNQKREINLLIKNLNDFTIPKNTLNIIIKNQYDLKIDINDDALFKDINSNFEIPIKLKIESNARNLLQEYSIRIEVISNNMDIISSPVNLKVIVKNDKEEDELNSQFGEFPSIILLPKEKKKKLQYIIKEKISIKTPSEIKAIMEKFKWSIDDAISDLVV